MSQELFDEVASGRKSFNVTSRNDGIFDDPTITDPSKGFCVECGLEVFDNSCKDLSGALIHQACLIDKVTAGSYTVEDIEMLEISNNITKNSWVLQHPEVKKYGCMLCSKDLADCFPDEVLVLVKQPITFAHKECTKKAIVSGKIDLSLARKVAMINNVLITDLLSEDRSNCYVCGEKLGSDILISPDEGLAHFACIKKLNEDGKLDAISAIKIRASNVLNSTDLGVQGSNLKKISQGLIRDLWNRFVKWIKSFWNSLVDSLEEYDVGIELAEQALGSLVAFGARTVNKRAITEDVQAAMKLLEEIAAAEKVRTDTLTKIMATYNISSLDKAKSSAMTLIKGYLVTLKSKQRSFSHSIFRLKSVKHREAFSSKIFREALSALVAQDAEMTKKINELAVKATTKSTTTEEVELVLQEVPSEVQDDLKEIEIPASQRSPAQESVPEKV
jgi:hypothetical protein